jgi:hypothetical protein
MTVISDKPKIAVAIQYVSPEWGTIRTFRMLADTDNVEKGIQMAMAGIKKKHGNEVKITSVATEKWGTYESTLK